MGCGTSQEPGGTAAFGRPLFTESSGSTRISQGTASAVPFSCLSCLFSILAFPDSVRDCQNSASVDSRAGCSLIPPSVRPASAAEGVTAGGSSAPSFAQPDVTSELAPAPASARSSPRPGRCAEFASRPVWEPPAQVLGRKLADIKLLPISDWAQSFLGDFPANSMIPIDRGGVLSRMLPAIEDPAGDPSRENFVKPPRRRIAKFLRPSLASASRA